MRTASLVVLLTASLALSSCETSGSKEQSGTLIGAGIGGLIGSQFGGNTGGRVAAGIIGAGIGGLIGNRIGAELDAQDRARLHEITTASIRTGRSRSFRNPTTGVQASTRVIETKTASGKLCRTVQQNVTLKNGSTSNDQVTGCKGSDGWSV